MKLQSIYPHLQEGALKVPQDQNCKIVFRHSIREKIDSGVRKLLALQMKVLNYAKLLEKAPLRRQIPFKKIVLKTREGMQNLTRF